MTENADSLLPEAIRDHPLLARLRTSLLADASDHVLLASTGPDPVALAVALSDSGSDAPDFSG